MQSADPCVYEGKRLEVVETARDILTHKLGLIEGARRLVRLRPFVTTDDLDPDFIPFIYVDSETDALPVGDERQYWASEALQKKDIEIQRAEEFYRKDIDEACETLVQRFGNSTTL
jgi:hypothetical protein